MIIEERAALLQRRINEKFKELALLDLNSLPDEAALMLQALEAEGFAWADMSGFNKHAEIFITGYTPQ